MESIIFLIQCIQLRILWLESITVIKFPILGSIAKFFSCNSSLKLVTSVQIMVYLKYLGFVKSLHEDLSATITYKRRWWIPHLSLFSFSFHLLHVDCYGLLLCSSKSFQYTNCVASNQINIQHMGCLLVVFCAVIYHGCTLTHFWFSLNMVHDLTSITFFFCCLLDARFSCLCMHIFQMGLAVLGLAAQHRCVPIIRCIGTVCFSLDLDPEHTLKCSCWWSTPAPQ